MHQLEKSGVCFLARKCFQLVQLFWGDHAIGDVGGMMCHQVVLVPLLSPADHAVDFFLLADFDPVGEVRGGCAGALGGQDDLTHVHGLLMMWCHHRHKVQIHLVDFCGLIGSGCHCDTIHIGLRGVCGVLVLSGA